MEKTSRDVDLYFESMDLLTLLTSFVILISVTLPDCAMWNADAHCVLVKQMIHVYSISYFEL